MPARWALERRDWKAAAALEVKPSTAPYVDAITHLARAIEMWEGCRDMAENDPDFDAVRNEPGFQALLAKN